jgi:hypothetical protein
MLSLSDIMELTMVMFMTKREDILMLILVHLQLMIIFVFRLRLKQGK